MTIILALVFLIVGCLVGYIYASRTFQREKIELEKQKDEMQKSLGLQKEETQKEIGDQKEAAQKELWHLKEDLQREAEVDRKKTLQGSRAGIKGKVSENLALLVPEFQKQHPDLNLSEARFIGEPIDYLFFEGMDDKNITKLVFLEVKSGKRPHLNEDEVSLRNVIEDAKSKGANVDWKEYVISEPEIPKTLTEAQNNTGVPVPKSTDQQTV